MFYNYNLLNYSFVNESEGMSQGNMEQFMELGSIDVYDDNLKAIVSVEAKDFVKVVTDAMYKISSEYKFLYWYIRYSKVFFIPNYPSEMEINTMAVDQNKNLWMNVHFIFNTCKMDKDRVFGILFHELMHNFLKHVGRTKQMFPAGVTKPLSMKCNICTDYEVNASMVEDGVVDAKFWKEMNGLYKKEYTGMRWEDILKEYGDKEYDEWLKRNGLKLSEKTKEALEAIEKASEVLRDPESTDAEKEKAKEELDKKMEEIFGKKDKKKIDRADLPGLVREIEKLIDTRLGDIGDLASKLQNVADDLKTHPKDMTESEIRATIEDVKALKKELLRYNDEIADTFRKTPEESKSDIKQCIVSLGVALNTLRKGVDVKEERKIIRKAKDDLEAIILNNIDKKKKEEKRKEAIEKHKEKLEKEKKEKEKGKKGEKEDPRTKEEKMRERIEELKKKNPLKKFLDTFINLSELSKIGRIQPETFATLLEIIEILGKLIEKPITEITSKDVKGIERITERLRIIFEDDLHNLVDKEILEWDKKKIKEFIKNVFDAVDKFFKILITDEPSSIKFGALSLAVGKLRELGKVLKTQRKIKPTEEWKKGYEATKNKLINIYKKKGKMALKAELKKMGVDVDSIGGMSAGPFKIEAGEGVGVFGGDAIDGILGGLSKK